MKFLSAVKSLMVVLKCDGSVTRSDLKSVVSSQTTLFAEKSQAETIGLIMQLACILDNAFLPNFFVFWSAEWFIAVTLLLSHF